MAAAFRSLYFWSLFNFLLTSMALAQDEIQFIYNGFQGARLQLDRLAKILPDGLLELTDAAEFQSGHAFHLSPFEFNIKSSKSISFSTHFVFATVPAAPNIGGNGMAFVISPSMDFSQALPSSYLGLFNISNSGRSMNRVLAIELDTVQSIEFNDIDGNHVGVDLNSLTSIDSATATYFSDAEGRNITLNLSSGEPIQIWIDYDGATELLNVTLASITLTMKPSKPLLSMSIDLSEIFLESMYVGFSAGTGTRVSGHYVLGWSFSSNGQAQNLNISNLPKPPPLPSPHRRSSGKLYQIIIVVIVAVAVVLKIIGITVYVVRKKKFEEVCEDWEKEYGPQRISYKSLHKGTNGFHENEVIGRGGFGYVYKGVLPPNNEQIAVKKIAHDVKEGMKEFVSEIASMGRLSHRSLVQLRGYCRRKGELLLAYDYMPNGSLDKILYNDMKLSPNWFQRFKIIQGVASGLLYLHEEWEQVVLHRDIKPGNILLDADLNGKLGDFGLARLYDRGSRFHTTNLVGTIGYLAPELIKTGVANTSTDVYAFGVTMLETACGRRPKEPRMVDLVDWVIVCWERGNILEACDKRLEGMYVEEQMEMILKLGLLCTHSYPVARPSMRDVMQYLDGHAQLPDIIPGGSMVGASRGSTEASVSVMSQSSVVIGDTSPYTMSTADSIQIVGR